MSINQAMFRKSQQKYLANHVINSQHANTELECSMHCVGDQSCASVNFKTSGTGKGLCELNSKTIKAISYVDGSMNNPEFNHLYKVKEKASGVPPTSEEVCLKKKHDILMVVDGSGSVGEASFDKVKEFIQKVNTKFDIGPGKTQEALVQFGSPSDTRIEFNLGKKKTLEEVNQGVEDIKFLNSGTTATGDALSKSRDMVFNGTGNDHPDAPNVLVLFTDGKSNDHQGVDYQVEQADMLKNEGAKIITVGMGKSVITEELRTKMRQIASTAADSGEPLMFEASYANFDSIANNITTAICSV
ncbi:collagen alpha-1(XII) chain-like [Dendronephthya gigantea]|uniref:collagen alpha-1(XII) chain-like n=1 Tax=Dendronephthya gigantea TaxID=151771 RepID=UPI00106D64BD|nr:collagen alpha-1(XII) chain-like [Dendronephthya gigantea]